jgi:hypothetical protein
MVDDTLSPVGFDTSRIAKTHLDGQERYAMACAYGEAWGEANGDLAQAAFVRQVLLAGLETLGWPEERRIEAYAHHRLECIRNGEANEYGDE